MVVLLVWLHCSRGFIGGRGLGMWLTLRRVLQDFNVPEVGGFLFGVIVPLQVLSQEILRALIASSSSFVWVCWVSLRYF